MEDGRGDIDRVARTHGERRLVVHHLLADPRENVQDFFGLGMIVADMALPGKQDDLAERDLRPRVLVGTDKPFDDAPVEALRRDILDVDRWHDPFPPCLATAPKLCRQASSSTGCYELPKLARQ